MRGSYERCLHHHYPTANLLLPWPQVSLEHHEPTLVPDLYAHVVDIAAAPHRDRRQRAQVTGLHVSVPRT